MSAADQVQLCVQLTIFMCILQNKAEHVESPSECIRQIHLSFDLHALKEEPQAFLCKLKPIVSPVRQEKCEHVKV